MVPVLVGVVIDLSSVVVVVGILIVVVVVVVVIVVGPGVTGIP